MKKDVIVIERTYNAPVSRVWKAITNKNEMKLWYFDLPDFKPEVGCKFQFLGGKDKDHQFLHLCEVTEVIFEKKLTYSWKYDGQPGNSWVTFELNAQGDKTALTLTHEGVGSFAAGGPDFAKENFVGGWTHFVHKALKEYLEKA